MSEIVTTVREVRSETAHAVTLRLDLNGAAFDYRPGQHIQIDPRQFEAFAAESRPSYFAIASDATQGDFIEITVKDSGSSSGLAPFLLRRARPGLRILIAGPGGSFGLPPEAPAGITGCLHVCAGSGAVPHRAMIRHALAKDWPQRHLLVLQNRAEADVLYRAEWAELARRHGERFRVRHVLSSTHGSYITLDLLREEMRGYLDPAASVALICGPNRSRGAEPGFRDRMKELVKSLGLPPSRIIAAG